MLGYPPFSWSPVAWLGVAILLWTWTGSASRARALVSGYLAGAAFFGPLLWWLNNVELIAYVPLVLVEALFFVWIAWVAWRFRTAAPWTWLLAVVGAWALSEAVRVRAPVGGFPWGVLGLTVDNTPLRASAQWIGASGWSVLLVGSAAAGVLLVRSRFTWRSAAIIPGAAVLIGALGLAFPATADGDALQVAVIQGNSPCPGSTCPNERRIIFEHHLELTRSLEPGETDLVIWPESATGFSSDPIAHPEFAELIGNEARRLGVYLLVGGDRPEGDTEFVNSNLLVDPSGAIVAEYRKTHPVPFGEYVPARPLFDWIPALDRVPRDMVRGPGPVTFDVGGHQVGTVISYEGAFARYPRAAVAKGGDLVVVATNEASFGDSPAAAQFIAMSRMRAAENGVDVVHAAITGRSAVLRADGSVAGPTGLFTGEILHGKVGTRSAGPTIYTQLGDWLQILASLVGLVVLAGSAVGSVRSKV